MKRKDEYNIDLRIANSTDLDEILFIYESNLKKEYGLEDYKLELYKKALISFFENRMAPYDLWVAIHKEKNILIGWQSYFPIFYTPLKQGHAVESSTYVHLEYQNSGVAYSLMTHALNEISRTNISIVYGFINSHNQGAIKLVRKMGFSEIGKNPAMPSIFPYYFEKYIYIYLIK